MGPYTALSHSPCVHVKESHLYSPWNLLPLSPEVFLECSGETGQLLLFICAFPPPNTLTLPSALTQGPQTF